MFLTKLRKHCSYCAALMVILTDAVGLVAAIFALIHFKLI